MLSRPKALFLKWSTGCLAAIISGLLAKNIWFLDRQHILSKKAMVYLTFNSYSYVPSSANMSVYDESKQSGKLAFLKSGVLQIIFQRLNQKINIKLVLINRGAFLYFITGCRFSCWNHFVNTGSFSGGWFCYAVVSRTNCQRHSLSKNGVQHQMECRARALEYSGELLFWLLIPKMNLFLIYWIWGMDRCFVDYSFCHRKPLRRQLLSGKNWYRS